MKYSSMIRTAVNRRGRGRKYIEEMKHKVASRGVFVGMATSSSSEPCVEGTVGEGEPWGEKTKTNGRLPIRSKWYTGPLCVAVG